MQNAKINDPVHITFWVILVLTESDLERFKSDIFDAAHAEVKRIEKF